MYVCQDCDTLLGKPTTTMPHASLFTSARQTRPYGTVENFTCEACGTHLERFRATGAWRHAPQFWEVCSPAWATGM